jgi:hypothetical protein
VFCRFKINPGLYYSTKYYLKKTFKKIERNEPILILKAKDDKYAGII